MRAVGNLQRVRQAISTARRVLENTQHTLLADSVCLGNGGLPLALMHSLSYLSASAVTHGRRMQGFPDSNLATSDSSANYEAWCAFKQRDQAIHGTHCVEQDASPV